MAVLSEADRLKIWRGIMRWWSMSRESTSTLTKSDIKDAVDTTDDWIDSNQSSFNAALPTNFRDNATQIQKTLLFCAVALMRTGSEFLGRIFGDID